MPLTAKEKSKQYRERKMKEMGREAFNKREAEKRKARREKAREKKKAEAKLAPSSNQPPAVVPIDTSTEDLKRVVKRLNEYLNKESKVDVPTIVQYVEKNLITNVVDIVESKGCSILERAVFVAKNKFLKFGVSEGSNRQNFQAIGRLYKYMTGEHFKCTPAQFEIFKDTKRVINAIETNPKWKAKNTKNKYFEHLSSVIKYLNGYDETYRQYSQASIKGRKKIQADEDELKLTEKERENFVQWKVLQKASNNNKLNEYQKALVGLYTLIPPRRREMARLLTLTDTEKKLDKKLNYLVIDKNSNPKKILLQKYKTAKTYGTYEMKLPAKLKTLLKNHIRENELKPGEIVFYTSKDKYHQGSNFSNMIQKIFKLATGKQVSFNLMRHSKIQDYLSAKRSIAARKKLAKQMGHDIGTQARYDRIFHEEESDEEESDEE